MTLERSSMALLNEQNPLEVTSHNIQTIIPGELSEAFARLDPDLSFLHEEMMAAMGKLNHLRQSGADMMAVQYALDYYESAKSSYQTRLIEVRENKLLNQSELSADEKDEKRVLHELSMQDRMNENFAMLRDKRQREKQKKERQEQEKGSWFLYFALGLMIAQMNARRYEMSNETNVSNRFSSTGNHGE